MSNNHRISSSNGTQACAACKYQRRKCAPDCILAPYFPHDRQKEFTNAHKLFGVSNIIKIIRHLNQQDKDTAMRTIIYESDMRAKDPVGGCYRIVKELQYQVDYFQAELNLVLQQLAVCRAQAAYQQGNYNSSDEIQLPALPPPPLGNLEASPVDDDQIDGDVIQASDPLVPYNNINGDNNALPKASSSCTDDQEGLNIQNYAQVVQDYQYLLAMQDSILGTSSGGCNTLLNHNVIDEHHHDQRHDDEKPQIDMSTSVYRREGGVYRFDDAAEVPPQNVRLLKFDSQQTTEESDDVLLKEEKIVVDKEEQAKQDQR